MDVLSLLKGRKMMVMTEMKVEVELTIKKVEENYHSRDLEESNAANDWWPAQETWKSYTVFFTNGAQKTYDSLNAIKIVEDKSVEQENPPGTIISR